MCFFDKVTSVRRKLIICQQTSVCFLRRFLALAAVKWFIYTWCFTPSQPQSVISGRNKPSFLPQVKILIHHLIHIPPLRIGESKMGEIKLNEPGRQNHRNIASRHSVYSHIRTYYKNKTQKQKQTQQKSPLTTSHGCWDSILFIPRELRGDSEVLFNAMHTTDCRSNVSQNTGWAMWFRRWNFADPNVAFYV